jgi:hypothetical protein
MDDESVDPDTVNFSTGSLDNIGFRAPEFLCGRTAAPPLNVRGG